MNEHPPLTTDGSRNRVHEMVQAVVRRRNSGEALSDEAVLAEFPDLADILKVELFKLRLIENAGMRADAPASEAETAPHNSTPHTPGHLRICCPYCRESFETPADTVLTDITCQSCGSSFSLARSDDDTRSASTLETLGHFELVERIGMGGFGTVWKGRDTKLDRTVAIKLPRQGALEPAEMEKFLREARAAAQLKHANIVSVHEVGRHGDTLYIVSDYVRGITLSDWLTGQRPTVREAAALCIKIADALHHAHEQGVIHRDLKPHNIMIDGAGEPHLMDFGLARRDVGEVTMTVEGQVLGTPAYMSPEQARGQGHMADRRSDVYSLGVILFELLTGERPFRGNAQMLIHSVINDEAPSPKKLIANVPRDLETVTLKCLEKSPDRRYHTSKEVSDELCRFLAGEPIQARPVGQMEHAWRWCRRNRSLATAIAMILFLLLAIVVASPIVALRLANSRIEADASRQKEIALHNRLLLNEKFDQAQMFISDGHFEEADLLIRNIEGWQSIISSRNAAEVLNQLACWHGSHKRWKDADEYFRTLLLLNLDTLHFDWNSASMLYVMHGPILVTLGDMRSYERMRESAIAEYRGHTNPTICERMLNACIILPPSYKQQITLKSWAKNAARFEGSRRDAGWNCLAIALWEFHLGNNKKALKWSQRAIEFELSLNCTTRAQLVKAMALFRLGRNDESRSILQQSLEIVEAQLRGSFVKATYETGYWHDWLAAGILLQQAVEVVENGSDTEDVLSVDDSLVN